MYKLLQIKRFLEDLLMLPFIGWGRLLARIRPFDKEYSIIYFFPFYHTGGAEQVHLQVVKATGGPGTLVIFTRRSADQRYLQEFRDTGATLWDISSNTDNKWLYFLNLVERGRISGLIHAQKNRPLVFNGQSNFGYKISRWINPGIPQAELIHSLNSFSYIRMPFLKYYRKTVMISLKKIEEHRELYQRYQVPMHYFNRILHIQNAIELPATAPPPRKDNTIVFVGRMSPEKRFDLFLLMARSMAAANIPASFEVAGETAKEFNTSQYPFIRFHGNIDDPGQLSQLYQRARVLVLTSETEGFPLVVMEAMAHGVAILATPVGDLPYHLTRNQLFTTIEPGKVVKEGNYRLVHWIQNPAEPDAIGKRNREHALKNFGMERFRNDYIQLFRELKEET